MCRYTCLDGLTEINTFFMVLRRQSSFARATMHKLYWATYVPLRLVMYPGLVPVFWQVDPCALSCPHKAGLSAGCRRMRSALSGPCPEVGAAGAPPDYAAPPAQALSNHGLAAKTFVCLCQIGLCCFNFAVFWLSVRKRIVGRMSMRTSPCDTPRAGAKALDQRPLDGAKLGQALRCERGANGAANIYIRASSAGLSQ